MDCGTRLDAFLSAALAAVCAFMGASAVVYMLASSPVRGAAVCAAGAAAALLCAPVSRAIGELGARRLTAAVFLLALGLRAVYVLTADSVPSSDFELLYNAARSLAGGDASALDTEYFRLWGYQAPFVLYEALVILLGGGTAALALLNALWGAITAALVFLLARRFAPDGAAGAAAALYAVCPDAIMLTPVLTNQCVSLAFILLGVYLACSPSLPRQLLAGLALALGDLMRPEGVLALAGIAAALICALIRRDGGKRRAAGFAALLAAYFALKLLASWAIGLSGAAPGGTGNAVPEWKFVLGLDTATGGMYDAGMEYILGISDASLRRAAALDAIRASLSDAGGLGGILLFFIEKAAAFWGRFEDSWLGAANASDALMQCAGRAVFIAVCALAAAGAFSRRGSFAAGCAGAVVCVNFAAYLLIEVQPRYRYFVLPFVCALAAAGIGRLGARRAGRGASGHPRGKRV